MICGGEIHSRFLESQLNKEINSAKEIKLVGN